MTEYNPKAAHIPHLSEVLRSRLYMTLQTMRGRPLARCMRALAEKEHLQQAEFERFHRQQLHEILEFARTHVPFYRSGRWRDALASSDVSLDDWPVLEKSELRDGFEQLLAEKQPWLTEVLSTSGTTGTPVRTVSSYLATTYGWAHRYRALQWHGIPIAAQSLRLTHDCRPFRDSILGQQCEWPLVSEDTINRATEFLLEKKPTLVSGTPSALFYLARRLREQGVTTPLAPFARCGGEQLFSFQRKQIESYLGAKAIDSYGVNETGGLAGECPAGSMHVHAGHVHLEIFRGDTPAQPGEFGDIVVTSLFNRAMPLIRYRVGDKGRLSTDKCACGLTYPILTDLQARSDDHLTMADGSLQHSSKLIEQLGRVFDDASGDCVRQIEFRQNSAASWEVWAEVPESFLTHSRNSAGAGELEDLITGLVNEVTGPGSNASVRFVSKLPREHGKFRYYRAERSTRRAAQAAP